MLANAVVGFDGIELPVWLFETFAEFDYFMDTLMSVEDEDTAGAWFQAHPMTVDGQCFSGVLFSRDCGGIQTGCPLSRRSRHAALAIIRIDEDLPQQEAT